MKNMTFMRSRFCTLLFLMLLVSTSAFAKKDTYNFTLTIRGNDDTMMLLGFYFAGDTYILDSARIDRKGCFVFSSKDRNLEPGLYFFANRKGHYVDFVVYHEKLDFSFATDEADWTANMVVKGSKQNEQFYNYHRASKRIYDLYSDTAAATVSRRQLALDSMRADFILRYPDCMLSKMMQASNPIIVPTLSPSGDSLSNAQRRDYFIAHYFDNMPLDDDMLVRTPRNIFYRSVMDFFNKYLKGAPADLIISCADSLIDRARPAKENFKWLVHNITEMYLQSHITLYEAVYVHLVQRYYASGDAFWSSPSFIDQEVERANRTERLLIGKVAPELVLFDTNHLAYSLHRMQHRYKLLVFWSPTCGHCKSIIPQLYEKFEQYREQYDIGAMAILTEPDDNTRPAWKRFINEHHLHHWAHLDGGEANVDWHEVYDVVTTPQIYLIDSDNRIIAKKLNADTFEGNLKYYCIPIDANTPASGSE